MKIGKCVNCKQERPIRGRNLCAEPCYRYHANHHMLDKFPRSTWKREELMREYNICKARGLSVREAAEKIGVSLSALRKAIERDRQQKTAAVGPRSS